MGTVLTFTSLLEERGVKIGLPSFPDIQNKPYVDNESQIHWPVIMLYPESGQVELIEDFEETSSFRPVLDMMFNEDASPFPWDTENCYVKGNIVLYCNVDSSVKAMPRSSLLQWLDGKHVGELERDWKKESWEGVSLDTTLKSVLAKENYIVPGIPIIHVLARNSFEGKFLNGDW